MEGRHPSGNAGGFDSGIETGKEIGAPPSHGKTRAGDTVDIHLRAYVSYTIPAGNVPGCFKYLDYSDVGSLLMPGALLVVHGLRDDLFPGMASRRHCEIWRNATVLSENRNALRRTPSRIPMVFRPARNN